MRYDNHNFFSNFLGGVNSKDVDLTLDLWVNEVSNLIIDSNDEIISLLNKTGIKAEKTDSYEQLADSILNNINSNSLLNKGICFLIAQENGITPDKNKDWKKAIDTISDKYAILFKSIMSSDKVKASIKADLMEHIKSKADNAKGGINKVVFSADTVEGKKKRRIKIAKYVLGGLAVVAIVYIGLHYYKKHKLSFENGGQLPPVAPNPVMNPTPTMPVSNPMPSPVVNAVAPMPTPSI